jgi:hypothetical protein
MKKLVPIRYGGCSNRQLTAALRLVARQLRMAARAFELVVQPIDFLAALYE